MKTSAPSISDLLARLTQLEDRTAKAEERAARAEARADRLENATGHLANAVVNPKSISRRNLLLKAAGVGAAGVAGSMLLNRPKDAYAIFTWQGGASNTADAITTVTAGAAFPSLRLLNLDCNQAVNTTQNIDGLQTFGANGFSGVAAYGGNKGGAAYYGVGGNAVGTGDAGRGLTVYQGVNNPNGGGNGSSTAGYFQGHGASDGTAYGGGLNAFGNGKGYGLWAVGGGGTTATPHVNGGPAIYAYGGPGQTAAIVIADAFNANPAIPAHGVRGSGNSLGVGGYFSGGRAQVQLIPNGGVGAPTIGPHFRGDLYMDAYEVIWVCIADGTPGVFAPLQPGGINNALFTAVSTLQYTFVGSNGVTWADMDPINLILTINPKYNCQAILTASADLWTAASGYNQDIGIAVSGGAYPTVAGQPEGWKESGGSAGTYSPNAAHVDTVVPLAAGTAYTVKLVWKTNKPAAGKIIAAGAGPIGGKFSPTRLTAWLVPTNPGGTIPLKPAAPYGREIPALTRPTTDQYGRKLV